MLENKVLRIYRHRRDFYANKEPMDMVSLDAGAAAEAFDVAQLPHSLSKQGAANASLSMRGSGASSSSLAGSGQHGDGASSGSTIGSGGGSGSGGSSIVARTHSKRVTRTGSSRKMATARLAQSARANIVSSRQGSRRMLVPAAALSSDSVQAPSGSGAAAASASGALSSSSSLRDTRRKDGSGAERASPRTSSPRTTSSAAFETSASVVGSRVARRVSRASFPFQLRTGMPQLKTPTDAILF